MTTSLEEIQQLAEQLSPLEQARLIEHLSRQLARAAIAHAPPPAHPSIPDAWARFFAMSDDIRATYPEARPSAQLETDRRTRDAAIRGSSEHDDVHP